MSRSTYVILAVLSLDILGKPQTCVLLVDHCIGSAVSVTNNAEEVVREINDRHPGCMIFYRDTENQWAELLHKDGVFQGFRNL